MRGPSSEYILEHLGETADDLAQVMHLTPDFLDQHQPRTAVVDMMTDIHVTIASETGDGHSVDSAAAIADAIEDIDAYNAHLGISGLASLRTPGPNVADMEFDSIVGTMNPYRPLNPERAGLTTSFMVGIFALKRIEGVPVGPINEWIIARRTKGLVRTLARVALDHPHAIHLPEAELNTRQAAALIKLQPFFGGRRNRELSAKVATAQQQARPESVSPEEWQETLRKDCLKWLTPEEHEEFEREIDRFVANARRCASSDQSA